jgi:hypothetical protein
MPVKPDTWCIDFPDRASGGIVVELLAQPVESPYGIVKRSFWGYFQHIDNQYVESEVYAGTPFVYALVVKQMSN